MATAFNEVLEHTEAICAILSSALSSSTGIVAPPRRLYPLIKLVQDRLQRHVAKLLIGANVETVDYALRVLNRLPEQVLFKFFSNELTWQELLPLSAQISLALPRRPR
jgi:hypothetical protein